jgi:hypothetical protein
MKRVLIALGLIVLLTMPAIAEETTKRTGENWRHTHSYTDVDTDTDTNTHGTYENRSNYEVGNYLDFVYSLNDTFDVGVKNSYLWENKEFTTLVGATIKFGNKGESGDSWE